MRFCHHKLCFSHASQLKATCACIVSAKGACRDEHIFMSFGMHLDDISRLPSFMLLTAILETLHLNEMLTNDCACNTNKIDICNTISGR